MSQPHGELPILTPQQQQQQQEEMVLHQRMAEIDHKLLVLSGKGGVGKSTVAANLALSLSQSGKRVGLLDVDVHGPSIPGLLGLGGQQVSVVGEEIIPVKVNDCLSVMSIGFLLPSNREPVIWRGPRKFGVIRQFLKDVLWGPLDYLVVDAPPGTGDEPLSVAQLVGSSAEAIVVTTPQQVAVADVRRCVTFCHEVSLPVMGILENMSGFICPKCGEQVDLFKSEGGRTLAEEMNVPFLGAIPIDPEIVTAGDSGIPSLRRDNDSPSATVFSQIIDTMLAAHGEK